MADGTPTGTRSGGAMAGLAMGAFWVTGIILYLIAVVFGLQMWGLLGLIAFAVIPPLEMLLPFIVWFTTGNFPGLIFALWAVQAFAILVASTDS